MQDIRKPYTRSKSNQEILSKVEEFESHSYAHKDDSEPVHIPVKRVRRNVNDMDMYPRRRREDTEDYKHAHESVQSDIVYRDPRTHYKRNGGSFGTWAFITTIILISVGAGFLTYVFDSATVTIVPKHEDINDFRKTITFNQNGDGVDNIAYIVATSSISKSKILPLSESKQVQAKASGKIVVYNNFDTNPQKLIKNTRFESVDGKIYRINQSITVPPKKGDTPGSIEVTVYADSYGADYNSAPTDFTIPGFKGTPRYKGFFAHSDGSITGGASGNISLASLSDINTAKDELALELAQEIKTELSKVKKEGYTNMFSATEIVYKDNEKDVLQGLTSTYEVTATGYLMLADSKQLASSIAKELRDYSNEPVKLGYGDTLVFTRKDIDHVIGTSTLAILVEGKPRVIWYSDEDTIKKLVAGKKRDEFKSIMKTIPAVEGAEIGFSPLWLTAFPNDTQKISVVESLPKR
ncbi:MAG: hypothetical protein WCT07_01925 [Candidatus Paceibacterota bacterium]|jgi:hypothetical protein